MSDPALALVEEPEAPEPAERPSSRLRRDADLLGRVDSACRKFLRKKIEAVVKGFEGQARRSDDLDSWWKIYLCEFEGGTQSYNGDAEVFVPIIHDAINARVTRYSNQLFPQSGKYIDVTATDGKTPNEIVALLNHYIRSRKMKTKVVKPLLRNGDIEGQYNLYVDWSEVDRQIVSRETHSPIDPMSGMELPGEDIEDIKEEEIRDGSPVFEVLHDSDVAVIPPTADTIEEAFAAGGSVTIVRRISRDKWDALEEAGEVKGDPDSLKSVDASMAGLNDLEKHLCSVVGVRSSGGSMIMLFETWLLVPLSDKGAFAEKGRRRLCRMWWSLNQEPVGCKRNPYWNDRCPLISEPVEKVAGVFKGKSLIEPLAPLQYEANDAANERADVDHMGSMPIVRRNPEDGNPPLIIAKGAVWPGKPGDIEFMSFPDLSNRARVRIMDAMQVIYAALSVTPAMLTQQTGRPGAKRNQAEIAMEQQIEMLSVAEAVEVPEALLNDALAWMVDLDHQFRDQDLTVRGFGELGVRAEMIDIPPMQNRKHYNFTWCGAQQAKQNVAMLQQGTGFINVMMNPQMQQLLQKEGLELRLGDLLKRQVSSMFGAVEAENILIDRRHQLGLDPELENDMLADGFAVMVHALDNDQQHIMVHRKAMMMGDLHGTFRLHIEGHMKAMQAKQAAAAMQQLAQAMQGGGQPQRPPPGRGAPGPARQGAIPAGPRRGPQGPPGMVRPDNLPGAGALTMPRRA